jgi:uncharacterized protein (DUF885 family)
MMRPSRRGVLAGVAATLATPRLDAADGNARAALDAAARIAEPDPAAALRLLDRVTGTTTSERLDLATARAGLGIDAALARTAPIRRGGKAPYRATPAAGAGRDADDPAAIDAETAILAADARAGVILPHALLDRLIAAIDTRRAAVASPVLAAALAREATTLRTLRAAAPAQPGLCHLPGGRAWYTLILRRLSGDHVAPETAERRLLAERTRLVAEVEALFATIGDTQGSVGDRYRRSWRDPRWLYADDAAGRAAATAAMNATLDAIRGRLDEAFGPLPPECLAVRATLPEADGRAGYRILPTSGRAGAYVVDLRDIRRRPSWTLPGVVAHELLPGHMIQLPLETLAAPHPLRLEYAPGFAEGWAIYAETLAMRLGWLGEAPYTRLGHLHWLLFRVDRALADLAIHYRGYPPASVHADLLRTQGEPAYFAPFDVELDRIAIEPGTRVAEALFWLTLADHAPRLGELRRYHHRTLAHGRVRMDLLDSPEAPPPR